MADDIKNLQREFNAASYAARVAYDKLQKWNTFPSKIINERKDEYEAIQKAYNDAQTKKNEARKTLEAAKTAEVKAKEVKAAESVYNKTLAALDKASLGLSGYKGEEKYIAAYQKALDAYNAVTEKGATPKKPLPESRVALPAATQQGEPGAESVQIQGPTNYSDALTYLTDPKNKESLIKAQKALVAFGYRGNTKGEPDATFTTSLRKAALEYEQLPTSWKTGNVLDYIVNPVSGGAGAAGVAGTAPSQYGELFVWDKPKTKSELNALYQNLLDRDATPEEIDAAYNKLNAKQKEQKATVTTTKVINGVKTRVTTPGFNQSQFLVDLVKGTKEYKQSVEKKTTQEEQKVLSNVEAFRNVARDNDILLSEDQLNTYANRVKSGEDINLIKGEIRKLASIGQPDSIKKMIESGTDLSSIYAPYRNLMGSVLEINPNTIPLNDPALRAAIGPDKEMSLYEYQRSLRKDPRWEYTNQARTEAANAITTVLKDFGFMG